MNLPRGRLLRQRVVTDLGTPLARALEIELTGYARIESQDSLLLDATGVGVITFEDGIPRVSYHTGTEASGPEALGDMAVAGPHRLELYELDGRVLAEVHDSEGLLVPPAMPAERLAGDPELAARTREVAPPGQTAELDSSPGLSAVEAFLDDHERIERMRERARDQATMRADQWGFDSNPEP